MQRLLEVCRAQQGCGHNAGCHLPGAGSGSKRWKPSKPHSVAPAASHGFEAEGSEGRQSLDMVSPVVLKKL